MLQALRFCFLACALLTQLFIQAQSTWQKTYTDLRAATVVVPDFTDGYIIGGTLINGNGVLIKVTEEGNEVWRTEIQSEKGLFIRDLKASAKDGSYYFAATAGYTNYISNAPFFPMNSTWKLSVSGVVGKINSAHQVDWIKKDLLVKGAAATSPLHLRMTANYLLISGYTSDGKSNIEGYMQLFQRNDGVLVKEQKLEQHLQDLYAKEDLVLTLSVVRKKGAYVLEINTLNEKLKQQQTKKTDNVVLSNFYAYPLHLLAFNNDKYACAFVHFYGGSKVDCGCFPVYENLEVNPKAHQLVPDVHCNGGCFFLAHAQDLSRDFILTGMSQTSAKDLYAGSRMLWNKYANNYKKGITRSYSYAEINKVDITKYTHTIGFDIAPTRDGGSIMAGFATNLNGENSGTFKERIGWVLKVNSEGTW